MRKNDKARIAGVGALACVACCVGPIVGSLAAIGIGTAVGYAVFGAISLVGGVLAVGFVLRRRQRQATERTASAEPISVALSATRVG